uniref:Uncharacterized protein n=1 Tax=Rhizophora mucronata TaxID=61149 RepID=A0A2P2NE37_RHIMU
MKSARTSSLGKQIQMIFTMSYAKQRTKLMEVAVEKRSGDIPSLAPAHFGVLSTQALL